MKKISYNFCIQKIRCFLMHSWQGSRTPRTCSLHLVWKHRFHLIPEGPFYHHGNHFRWFTQKKVRMYGAISVIKARIRVDWGRSQIGFFSPKRHIFLHACGPCPGLHLNGPATKALTPPPSQISSHIFFFSSLKKVLFS